jgi:hydrogenase maturation protein HypF
MLLEAAGDVEIAEPIAMPVIGDTIDTRPLIREIASISTHGASAGAISDVFHTSLAHMMEMVCVNLRSHTGITRVCMSGGAFQNCRLLGLAAPLLRCAGFEVFLHSGVPANDGGISLGQAAIAATYLKRRSG